MTTLKQLRYFEALSRTRHFGQAAEECAISQPALSMKIQELEKELGVPLVERRRGDIQITRMGEEIAARARAILTSVRDLSDYARHSHKLLSGPLTLGVIPSIAPYLLPTALPLLRRRHPALELILRETQTEQLVEELLAGSLDALLLSLPIEHPDIVTLPLFEDAFLLATHEDRELGEPVRPQDLAAEKLLLLEEGHCLRDQALAYCGDSGSKERGQFGSTSLTTVVQLVANGYGITLLPEMAVPFEAGRDKRIRVHRFAEPQPCRAIGLAWRRTSPRSVDFKALAAILTKLSRMQRQGASKARQAIAEIDHVVEEN